MPELPEVETITGDLITAGFEGACIETAKVFWERSIATPEAAVFTRRIAGAYIEKIFRRGKFIVFNLRSIGSLLIHLRMSGRIVIANTDEPRGKHQHVIMTCRKKPEIRFHDPRKFGRFYLVEDAAQIIGRLGPEPLADDFKWRHLKQILLSRNRMIKPLLLDQRMIAGLGNIYVDEALWEARIHPVAPSNLLSDQQVKALFAAIQKVLHRGLRNRGTALGKGAGNFAPVGEKKGSNQTELKVFRRQKNPCPRCQEPIVRMIIGQRSTHICPRCQPVPDF